MAAAEADSRQATRDWWETLRCKGLVKLADVQVRSIKERNTKSQIEKSQLAKEFETVRGLYEEARKIGKFTERLRGSLP